MRVCARDCGLALSTKSYESGIFCCGSSVDQRENGRFFMSEMQKIFGFPGPPLLFWSCFTACYGENSYPGRHYVTVYHWRQPTTGSRSHSIGGPFKESYFIISPVALP